MTDHEQEKARAKQQEKEAHDPAKGRAIVKSRQFRTIKGTRDLLPPESGLWNWFEQTAREVFETYNFRDIRTPLLESYELFARSVGEESDIVAKELLISWDAPLDQWDILRQRLAHTKRFWDALESTLAGQFQAPVWKIVLSRDMSASEAEKAAAFDKWLALDESLAKSWNQERAHEFRNYLAHLSSFDEWTKMCLRPEATASVCRAYIEHGMHTLAGNVKLYYVGPMFRRERPQKGRYRQFYQIGAEVLGQSDAPGIDAELIEMLLEFFRRVGLTETTLYLNSIGDKKCRPLYVELLRKELETVKDKLGPDSQRRIETNPLRVLDSKLPVEQAVIEKLPRISEHLCAECREHFAKLKEELALRGIQYVENWRLVRGLDYYTRTTFEVTAKGLGSQDAVCGGGRYDGLVELLGGPPTKGTGFAIGSDRSILSIQETGKAPAPERLAVFVAWMGAKAYPAAVEIARKLRGAGLSVEVPAEEMKFRKSLGLADKLGARYALILGEDEIATGLFTLKNLTDANQQKLSENELLEYLESERRGKHA